MYLVSAIHKKINVSRVITDLGQIETRYYNLPSKVNQKEPNSVYLKA